MKKCNLSLGEKIKAIRKARDITQETLAFKINYSRTALGDIERGTDQCDMSTLIVIKQILGIQGMPLFEDERKGFVDRLYLWNDMISEHNFELAKQIQKELSPIVHLPFEKELNDLYSLFSSRLLLVDDKFELATNILTKLAHTLDKANNDIMFWFYYNNGTLAYCNKQYQKALDFYTKAFKIMKGGFEENKTLHYYIANCLSALGYFTNVVMFIDNYCNFNATEKKTDLDYMVDNLLAINLIKWGYVKRANKILSKSYIKAEADKNIHMIGHILHNMGYLYYSAKNWDTALIYYDKVFDYCTKENLLYLQNLYQKTRCLVEINAYAKYPPLIAEGKELSKENEIFSVMFESLKHLTTLNEENSLNYIENEAIPYLSNKSVNDIVLDYCELLRDHYQKNNSLIKSLKMAEMCGAYYKNAYELGVVEWERKVLH